MGFRVGMITALLVLFPISSVWAAEPISRRDGFLLLWNSIARPAEATREKSFSDVKKGEPGFKEITYAKARGILDSDESFHPTDPLSFDDAVLWAYRTRSVDELKYLTREALPAFEERYPLHAGAGPLTEESLTALMRTLDDELAAEKHEVSLYAEKFQGQGTAFGETFNMYDLTAAHRSFPGNTLVEVTNIADGKSVIVRINDRGPYVKGRDMDLSLAAFTTIADRKSGKFMATFRRLGDASLVGACMARDRFQTRIAKGFIFTKGVPHALSMGKTLTLAAAAPFVVQSVRYPDGTVVRLQNWIFPEEDYTFKPSEQGTYVFTVGTKAGKNRPMSVQAVDCPEN